MKIPVLVLLGRGQEKNSTNSRDILFLYSSYNVPWGKFDPVVKNHITNLCVGVCNLKNHIFVFFRDAVMKETRVCRCTM